MEDESKPSATAAFLRNRDMWIRAVVESPDLGHAAVRVGVHIAMRMSGEGDRAWPAIKTIAKSTGVSVRGVIDALARLEDEKFLVCLRRRNVGNHYWLRFIWDE